MIRSMTGFGAAAGPGAGRQITVEIKSVNNRFREVTVRLPKVCAALEEAVRKLAAARLERGRVDVWVQLDDREIRPIGLKVDWRLVEEAAALLEELRGRLCLDRGLTLDHLLTLGVIGNEPSELNLEELWAALKPLVEEALAALVVMREAEGRHLGLDLSKRLATLSDLGGRVRKLAAGAPEAFLTRLQNRLAELSAGLKIDPARLAQEAALLAERADVTEELVRLDSHLDRFSRILAGHEAAGRRLDFLIQEMGREVNTIGSKSQDLEITGLVLDMKAELEKLREQVQNIE